MLAALSSAPLSGAFGGVPSFAGLGDPWHPHSWLGYETEWSSAASDRHAIFQEHGEWSGGPGHDRFYLGYWIPSRAGLGIGRQRPLTELVLFDTALPFEGVQAAAGGESWWLAGIAGRTQESGLYGAGGAFADPLSAAAVDWVLPGELELRGAVADWGDASTGVHDPGALVSLRAAPGGSFEAGGALGVFWGEDGGEADRRAFEWDFLTQGSEHFLSLRHERREAGYSRLGAPVARAGWDRASLGGRLSIGRRWDWIHQSWMQRGRYPRAQLVSGAEQWRSFLREELSWRGAASELQAELLYRDTSVPSTRIGARGRARDAVVPELELGVWGRLDAGRPWRWSELLIGTGDSFDGDRRHWSARGRLLGGALGGGEPTLLSTSLHLDRQSDDDRDFWAADWQLSLAPGADPGERMRSTLRVRGSGDLGARTDLHCSAALRADQDGIVSASLDGGAAITLGPSNRIAGSYTLIVTRMRPALWGRTSQLGLLWQQSFGGPKERIWREKLLPSLRVRVSARPRRGPGEAEPMANVTVRLNDAIGARTDATGWARFARLDPGPYHVALDSFELGPNYGPSTHLSRDIVLPSATEKTLRFGLRASCSVLAVVWNDIDGEGELPFGYVPIPEVPLIVDGIETFETDSTGSLLLPNRYPGAHRIALDLERLDPRLHATTETEQGLELVPGSELVARFGLRAFGRLGGRLLLQVGPGEAPSPGPAGVDIYANGRWIAETDAGGRFETEAPVGRLALEARLRALPRAPIAPVSAITMVRVGLDERVEAELVLPRHCRLRVRITDEQGAGSAASGIPVEIVGGAFQYASHQGEVLFDRLEPGPITVQMLPDYLPQTHQLVSPPRTELVLELGEEMELELLIRRRGR